MPDNDLTNYLYGSNTIQGSGCFAAGTLVQTPSGPTAIERITKGQRILAFNHDCDIVEANVLELQAHEDHELIKLQFWGDNLVTTKNHLFYIEDINAFEYAGRLTIDSPLRDMRGGVRPVEYIGHAGNGTVYNLTVNQYHTYLVGKHGIFVHNGGGKGGGSPSEADVVALSRATIKIIELVSEGPIEGFKVGTDVRENIFLNDTPVMNSDGSLNFTNYQVNWRSGSPTQPVIAGFGDEVGSETAVNQDVTVTFPVTRQIINNQLDAIRIRLGFQLQEYEDDGDITGQTVTVRIYIKQGNGDFVLRGGDRVITARFETLTEYDYYFPVNNAGGNISNFTIRIESDSPDTPDSRVQRVVRWQSYTEVIEQKLSYPHSAIIAQSFAAEQFNSVPDRSYFIGGLRCRIPTNATVDTDGGLIFSGTWDMSLYRPVQAVSDPAWQILELLTNDRFGLGNRITLDQISLASLYQMSLHNNQLVLDGFGGSQRRYLCNTVMQSTEDAHDQIQLLLNACNAKYYWGGTKIYFWQDRPGESVSQVNNAIVSDGTFKYASTDVRSRNSICNVVWNDPEDNYRRAVEPVDVQEAIDKYGIRQVDFTAPGCTSRGQAVRAGRRRIYTDLYETETCTFSMAIFGIKFRPGDIIDINDWKKPNQRYSGLVISGTTTDINLDAPIALPAGATYNLKLTLPISGELALEERVIANSAGTHQTISVTTPFTIAPVPGAVWSVNIIAPKQFRVLGMRSKTDNESIVEIVAGEYFAQKQDLIETGITLTPIDPPITVPAVVPPPVSVGLTDITINETLTLEINWVEPTDSNGNRDLFIAAYQYQYKRGINGTWSETRTATGTTTARVEGLITGTYYARVATVYISGNASVWRESQAFLISDVNLYFNYRRPKSAIAVF